MNDRNPLSGKDSDLLVELLAQWSEWFSSEQTIPPVGLAARTEGVLAFAALLANPAPKETPADTINEMVWYVQPNDLIGGWCVTTVDSPPSQHTDGNGGLEVACFISEGTARHIVAIHNQFVRLRAADRSFGTPRELLALWYAWWEKDENAPVKLPDSLHTRTACLLDVYGRVLEG